MAGIGVRPTIALEIDGVPAILDLVAERMGCAILSRHAVASSIRPSAYSVRQIDEPRLLIRVSLASSAQRPATLTQQATAELIRDLCAAMFPAPAARTPAARG